VAYFWAILGLRAALLKRVAASAGDWTLPRRHGLRQIQRRWCGALVRHSPSDDSGGDPDEDENHGDFDTGRRRRSEIHSRGDDRIAG